jgi:hypothetical protein
MVISKEESYKSTQILQNSWQLQKNPPNVMNFFLELKFVFFPWPCCLGLFIIAK